MSLQIGALGSSPASLIHTWQQINLSALFRRSVSLPLGIEIRSCECSYLHVSLRMNSPMCVHNVSSLEWGGEESVKRNERPGATRSHFMSLQTGTLDSRSLAYFSCHPAAKSDYYLTVLGEWALVGVFSLCQSALAWMWRSASGCTLPLVTGGGAHLSGSDCPSSVQSRAPDLGRRSISWSNH